MKPHNVLLFITVCLITLGILCLGVGGKSATIGSSTLRWPTLASVLDIEEQTPQGETLTDSLDLAEGDSILMDSTIAETEVIPNLPLDTTIDTRAYLRTFYASLSETPQRTIRIVHYGDSQIEEDRMTMTLRRHLQDLYGGGGVGIIPLHQTIKTITLRQQLTMNGRIQTIQQGPKRNLVYGPSVNRRTDGMYGPMGQVAVMNDSVVKGSEHITLEVGEQETHGNKENRFSRIHIFADGNIRAITAKGDTVPATQIINTGDTTAYKLTLIGRGRVYGLSLEKPTGIIMDNVPMRGCLGNVFTNINADQLSTFYRQTNTKLIIMQFGGNAIPYNEKSATIRAMVSLLRKQVQYIKTCAPGASILFIGPSDMITTIDGVAQTYPLLPYMDKLLLRMAQEEHIGYYSLYKAQGGSGSMIKWQEQGIAGADGVHFTRRGAEISAEKLWKWIEEGIQNENIQ